MNRQVSPDSGGTLAGDEGDASRCSIVQFTSGMVYAVEREARVEIVVMRIGRLDTECSVTYCAKQETNDAAVGKYDKIEPTLLTFKPGESFKSIHLQLWDNDSYDNVVEVKLALADPAHCTLGVELRMMRVKIIDDDVFPTAKFKDDVMNDYTTDTWRTGKDFTMMIEFAKFTFENTMPGSIYMLIADQVKNLLFILQLTVNKLVIALLSSRPWDGGGSTEKWTAFLWLLWYAFLLSLPYGINHYLLYRRQFWKVGGGARSHLLHGLFDKYLYYEESTRDLVHKDEFKVVFAEETMQLVDKGFMKLFVVVKDIGRVLMVFIFLLAISIEHYEDKQEALIFWSLGPLIFLPPAMIAYMWRRQEESEICRERVLDAKVDLVHYMHVIVEQTSLVMSYFARPLVMDHCRKKIMHLNCCLIHEGVRLANDVAFYGWLQRFVTFAAVIIGGVDVIFNDMELATFTAVLSALISSVGLLREVYLCFWDLQEVYPCLWHLVEYMNHPTDLKGRLTIEKARADEFKKRLGNLLEAVHGDVGEQTLDQLDITLKDVVFSYFAGVESEVEPSPSIGCCGIKNISMHIKQGHLIAVTGEKSGTGCKTLMRLIAGQLLPQDDDGNVDPTCTSEKGLFVPPHLRVLYVAAKPTLLDGPIALSVFFGLLVKHQYTLDMYTDLKDSEIERGLQICRRLNIPDDVIGLIHSEVFRPVVKCRTRSEKERIRYGHRKVLSRMTASTTCKIQLACALISDPQVLVLDKPIQFLTMEDGQAVMKCLREFVSWRGLEYGSDDEKMLARRPRTVIISSKNKLMLTGADLVVTMNEDGIVSERVDIENVSNEMEEELQQIQKSVHSFSEERKRTKERTLRLATTTITDSARAVAAELDPGQLSI